MTHPHRTRIVLSAVAVLALAASPVTFAAAGGHPQLQVFFQSVFTDAAYQQKAFARVAKNFKLPPASQAPALGKKTVVQTVIAKDGKLLSAITSMASGSKAWDDAALNAVKKAAPFPPLPKGFEQPTVEVHFHFSWEKK